MLCSVVSLHQKSLQHCPRSHIIILFFIISVLYEYKLQEPAPCLFCGPISNELSNFLCEGWYGFLANQGNLDLKFIKYHEGLFLYSSLTIAICPLWPDPEPPLPFVSTFGCFWLEIESPDLTSLDSMF